MARTRLLTLWMRFIGRIAERDVPVIEPRLRDDLLPADDRVQRSGLLQAIFGRFGSSPE
jgi:hypothetical protein